MLQRRLADEVVLGHPHRELHARGGRLVLGGHIGPPQPVALLDPQAVEGDPPGGDHVVGLAGVEEQIPQRRTVFGAGVDLPAELADIGHPQHRDGDRAEVGLQCAEVFELLVRQVVGAQRRHHVAGPRSPHADAAGAAGDVAQRHVARQVAAEPVEVHRPVDGDLEPGVREPGDGDIASDSAVFVEQHRVGDRSDALVDVVGGHPLQECRRACARDLVAGQRGHVVHRDPLAGPVRLGDRDRRPESRRPVVALGERQSVVAKPLRQFRVRLEPRRAFPARTFVEECAELLLPVVERAGAQTAQRLTELVADG